MKKLLLTTCMLLGSMMLIAQQTDYKITVTDMINGQPLVNVSVKVKGTMRGTATDNNGVAVISASAGETLELTRVGYLTETLKLGSEKEVSVKMIFTSIELPDVVLVGTRSAGRVKTETPVPVDVVPVKSTELQSGRSDLTAIMNYAAPSLNYNKQSGSDGGDHVDLATLRGLGPDQTLVLINGKRRHQSAFVAVFGTRGRGNSGTDLNALPVSAIDRVEILRDGASAQYGSDAIAGVINLVLKKSTDELTADAGFSGFYDKKYNPAFKPGLNQYVFEDKFDGRTFNANLNYGLKAGKKGGFVNLSAGFLTTGKTYRQNLDTSDFETNENALPVNIYRRPHGDASVTGGSGFLNAEFPVQENGTVIYAFGGGSYRKTDAYAFTRNWSLRPDRFPTDDNGNLIFVPDIMMTSGSGIYADPDTFYTPHIQTQITDLSLAAGVKGKLGEHWNWDLSNTIGRNDFHFYGDKTFNASLGADKTRFDDGGFSFLQNTVNLNLDRKIDRVANGMNLAAGLEYRFENYTLYAGEPDSYRNYDPNGDKATGAQGFPGYQPSDEADATRSAVGVYADAEVDVSDKWLVSGAVRLENYSDFGFTHNYKLATRYKLASDFNLRGSVSTGFRAPSLQQIHFSSTFTTVQGGIIAEVKIAPNDNPITRAAGIPELNEEKSVSASIGFAWKPIPELSLSVDGYHVQVNDRIVLSGQFDASDPTLDSVFTAQLNALNVAYAQFFANAVNTTNQGIDVVLDYKRTWGKNMIKFILAGNIQKMTIDKINVPSKLNDTEAHRQTFLSDREQAFILASAPKQKGSLGIEYGYDKLTLGTRLSYFGKVRLLGYGEDGLGINPQVPTDEDPAVYVPDEYIYSGKLTTDLFLSYRFCKCFTLYAGVDNVFNVHPDLGAVKNARGWAYNNETGGPWDAVQMGGNGTRFFAKAAFVF